MAQKRQVQVSELSKFVQQYCRKRQKGKEPNDRGYDRKLEAKIKRMKAEEIDKLMRDAENDEQ